MSQCMDFLMPGRKKVAVVERWLLADYGSTGSYLQLNFEFESHPISIFIWNLAKGR